MMSDTGPIQRGVLLLKKYLPWQELKNIQWMNKKASAREAYSPAPIEHILNVITHGVWIIPSIIGTLKLCSRSTSGTQLLSALIYGATLIFLFCVSTIFHCVFYCHQRGPLKDLLHRCDRAMIYIFIAGSYFPWLTIQPLPAEGWASSMKLYVWVFAILGIIYQQVFHEKYKSLETFFYLVMGIGPALAIINEHELSGMTELKIGGVLYMLGVVFFKSDGCIPCAHAIWHMFVVMAAGIHYYAILNYLYPILPLTESLNAINS